MDTTNALYDSIHEILVRVVHEDIQIHAKLIFTTFVYFYVTPTYLGTALFVFAFIYCIPVA
jgi:hypothetical protein